MFIKKLSIKNNFKIIREINFNKGLNLIVDNTPLDSTKTTGNNVGKTTVLKLIDYCLGGDQNLIYTDIDAGKEVYQIVKDFLYDTEVIITLTLKRDLDDDMSEEIIIERNFLKRSKSIRKINGLNETKESFENRLKQIFFPDLMDDKPTLRQLIAHNIRYKDYAINNTLNHIHPNTKAIEYESLYLYMFGCKDEFATRKQELNALIKQERKFISRLEANQVKSAYITSLAFIESEISRLIQKKDTLNINENFEHDLNELNNVKYRISKISASLTNTKIKKSLIEESLYTLNLQTSDINLNELRNLYAEVKNLDIEIQKSFEDLVIFHNTMVQNKAKYITKELPSLEEKIAMEQSVLSKLILKEKELASSISQSDSFDDLNQIIAELNEKYQQKGEYENLIKQINDAEILLRAYMNDFNSLGANLYSVDAQQNLILKIHKFNEIFSSISKDLYDEPYLLNVELGYDRQSGKPCYKFYTFNSNIGSGKKQGEILSFDLAYVQFADKYNIPCMHFILNDKKELMDDKQLLELEKLVERFNVQVVISILKDKLPVQLQNEKYYAIQLSQYDKLFKIENS